MLRVKVDLIPTGLDDFTQPVAEILIGCKLPLTDPTRQDLFIISQGFYCELRAYDLQGTLYAPQDGKPRIIDICQDAIDCLKQKGKRLRPDAIYPGSLALDPADFQALISDLAAKFPDIQRMTLIGRRAQEPIGFKTFIDKYNQHAAELGGRVDGRFFFAEYPGYIGWQVVIEGATRTTEELLTGAYSLRAFPRAPGMRCHNGVMFYFARKDGSLAAMPSFTEIVSELPDIRALAPKEARAIHTQLKAGRVIYQAAKSQSLTTNQRRQKNGD